MSNLNHSKIDNADGEDVALVDFSCTNGEVEVIFRDIKSRLISEIKASKAVLGCVAWLTDFEILDALGKVQTCLVVQKEDFLRPDTQSDNKSWKIMLRASYERLKSGVDRYSLPGVASRLNTNGDTEAHGVRCVGNHNSAKVPAFPRMHNKFLVFGEFRVDQSDLSSIPVFVPEKVWTGSFNFTKNAGNSFENAIIIKNATIAEAYSNEFAQIFALSEDLDWESDWIEPFFRIGT